MVEHHWHPERFWARDVLLAIGLLWGGLCMCFVAMISSATSKDVSLKYLGWARLKSKVYTSDSWVVWCESFFNGTVACSGTAGDGIIGLRHVTMSYERVGNARYEGISKLSTSQGNSSCIVPMGTLCSNCAEASTTSTTMISLGFVAALMGFVLGLIQLHVPTHQHHRNAAKFTQVALSIWCVICAIVALAEMNKCMNQVELSQGVENGPMITVAAVSIVVGICLCGTLLVVKPTHEAAFTPKTARQKLQQVSATKLQAVAAFSSGAEITRARRGSRVKVTPAEPIAPRATTAPKPKDQGPFVEGQVTMNPVLTKFAQRGNTKPANFPSLPSAAHTVKSLPKPALTTPPQIGPNSSPVTDNEATRQESTSTSASPPQIQSQHYTSFDNGTSHANQSALFAKFAARGSSKV